MFGEFLKRLTAPTPDQLPQDDARLALCALLVRIARSDGHYDADEKAQIQSVVQTRYGLSVTDADDLLKDAEGLEAEAPDTVRFTRAIKDAVAYEERLAVLEALWRVALSDGTRSDEENALLRLSASLLGISDVDSNRARRRASQ